MQTQEEILLINTKKLRMKNRNWNFTILQICEEIGISIPRFCYHRELSIVGNCRMCMVELKNSVKPVIACATSLSKNMHILTNSELVKSARGNVLEFLLINHPLDCPIRDQGGECDLQDQSFIYGSDKSRFVEHKRSVEDKSFGPIIKTVMSRCIHCTRCIRYAEEIIGVFSIGTMGRGKETEISTYNNSLLQHEMIGNIADICPVGALLIKPTAFKARTWDLDSLDLLDIFDSLVGTASMGMKGGELLRILPRRNDYLNKEWITDKIRFFYEGVKINRLLFPLIKKNKNIIHCSLLFACDLYANKLYESFQQKFPIVAFIGDELNYYDSFLISHYSNYLNIFYCYVDQYKKQINSDFRFKWLLNEDLQSFFKKQNLLFLNVNMKYECSILNSLLYKNINESENQNIYYIGTIFKNSYPMKHLGLGNNTLKKIQKGQHEYCFYLLSNEVHWVESGIQPLFEFSLDDYLTSIKHKVISYNISYLASSSTEVNILESGINSFSNFEDLKEKKIFLSHIFGNISDINLFWENDSYKVYFSHHMPEKHIKKFDIYLPVVNFHEWSSKLSGPKSRLWLNNQLISQVLFDYMIADIGTYESYHGYFSLFLDYLVNKYFKKNEFKITLFNDIFHFLKSIEVNNKYKKYYKSNFNQKIRNQNISFVCTNLMREISPIIYYKSNIYIKNSVTLAAVYDNYLLSNQLNLFINPITVIV